jgi:hypothetical protein
MPIDYSKLHKEARQKFEGITPDVMWAVVKLMKAARRSLRSNAAFNNFMNQAFNSLGYRFSQIEKTGKDRYGQEKKYMGLKITHKETVLPEGDEEDEGDE